MRVRSLNLWVVVAVAFSPSLSVVPQEALTMEISRTSIDLPYLTECKLTYYS
jgi:hypothetical protein